VRNAGGGTKAGVEKPVDMWILQAHVAKKGETSGEDEIGESFVMDRSTL
jgi:hypothetical protein